jgi:hypothetical protein
MGDGVAYWLVFWDSGSAGVPQTSLNASNQIARQFLQRVPRWSFRKDAELKGPLLAL